MRYLLPILCLFVFSCDNNPTMSQEDDFTSILVTDEQGNHMGYEGNENNYGGCISSSDLSVSYPYPNPSMEFSIDVGASFTSADITITVINDSYEHIATLFDSTIPPFGAYSVSWSGLDFNYNQTPNGYYRMLVNSSNGDEICYFNLKKLP